MCKQEIDGLANQTYNDKLSTEEVAIINEMKKKEKELAVLQKEIVLSKVVDLQRIKYREQTKQFYMYVERKQITASCREDLIENLYEFVIENNRSKHVPTLPSMQSIFTAHLEYKRDMQRRSPKTLKEYVIRWKLLSAMPITKKNLESLDLYDWMDALQQFIAEHDLHKRAFNDFKSVLISVYDYAIIKKIIKANPLKELKSSMLIYAPEEDEDDTEEKVILTRQQMLSLQELAFEQDNLFSLAIVFQLNTGFRVGELKGIRSCDLFEDCVRVKGQVVDQQELITDAKGNINFSATQDVRLNHVKGRKKQGYRSISLTDASKRAIARARELNPEGEYIFMPEGNILKTITYNRHIKRLCKQLNFDNYQDVSSHSLRFALASYLHKSGVDVSTIQYLLGHTTRAMTLKYLRLNAEEEKENLATELSRLLA